MKPKNFFSVFGSNLTFGTWEIFKNILNSDALKAVILLVLLMASFYGIFFLLVVLIHGFGYYGIAVFAFILYVLFNFGRSVLEYFDWI